MRSERREHRHDAGTNGHAAESLAPAGRGDGRAAGMRLPLAVVPLVLALAWGMVQLLPWNGAAAFPGPRAVAAEVATHEVATQSAPSSGNARPASPALAEGIARNGISLYPASTRFVLAQLTIATTLFCLGALLFETRIAQRWLWGALAVNGAVLAFYGIVQRIMWRGSITGTIPTQYGSAFESYTGSPFATYVCRNNAGGYLNLCLAAAIGFVVWACCRTARNDERPGGRSESRDLTLLLKSPAEPSLWTTIRYGIARLDGLALGAVALVAVIMAGVLASYSRGAVVAMVGAGLCIGIALWQRRRMIWIPLVAAVAVVCGVGLVGWSGLSERVGDRLAPLADRAIQEDGRWQHWAVSLRTGADSLWTGTGLGTYRYAYQPYEDGVTIWWYYFAENQYVEALVEGGLPGLLLLLGAIGCVLLAVRALLRPSMGWEAVGAGLVGLFALAGQGIHALTDFGIWMPANMMALAVLCGAVCGRAVRETAGRSAGRWLALPEIRPRLAGVAVMGVLLANGVVGVQEVSAASVAFTARTDPALVPDARERRRQPAPRKTVEELDHFIERLTRAVDRRPDDAELRVALADLWIARYRAEADQAVKEWIALAPVELSADQLRELTDVASLHRRANEMAQSSPQDLERLRNDPIVVRNLRPAVEHLVAAKEACPILPRADLRLATVAFVADAGAVSGEAFLRRAVTLTPGDLDVLFDAGELADQAGLERLAFLCWQRSLELAPEPRRQILSVVTRRLPVETVVRGLMPERPELLIELGREYYQGDEAQDARRVVAARAGEILERQRRTLAPARWHYLNAAVQKLQGEPRQAADSFREALRLEPTAVDWRLELARLLRDSGQWKEAHEEVQLCAAMQPEREDIRKLLRELHQTRLRQPSAGVR